MKVLFLLISCFALSRAQYGELEGDVFEVLEQYMSMGMEFVSSLIKDNLLSDDGTSFNPMVNGILTMVEPQICPVELNQCSSGENWLFGCKCVKGFRALGECKAKPCQLFRHYRENGPAALNSFINSESYEERYQIVMQYVIEPISRALCECPGMIGASTNCARNYDGTLFTFTRMDRTQFDSVVAEIDWKALKAILHGWVKGVCGEKNGKDCVAEISNANTLSGRWLDNTFRGEDSCQSLIRLEEEFTVYMETVSSFNMTTDSVKSVANKFVDVYSKMQRKSLCDPGCAAEVMDSFYSCCVKHSIEVSLSKPMRKNYQKLFRNMWGIFSENKVPSLNSAVNKYLAVMDFDGFCKDQTNVYGERNEECESLGA